MSSVNLKYSHPQSKIVSVLRFILHNSMCDGFVPSANEGRIMYLKGIALNQHTKDVCIINSSSKMYFMQYITRSTTPFTAFSHE